MPGDQIIAVAKDDGLCGGRGGGFLCGWDVHSSSPSNFRFDLVTYFDQWKSGQF